MNEPVCNIDNFLKKLRRESDKIVLSAIHERLMNNGYKIQAKHKGVGGAGFDIKYSIKSKKPIVEAFYKKNKSSDFELHVRPLHVFQYAHRFSELSEHIKNSCIQGRDCIKCGYCDKAYEYEYEGIKYVKCQFICYNFCFTDIEDQDVDSILRVLDMELERIL
jgi:hypothetical protein